MIKIENTTQYHTTPSQVPFIFNPLLTNMGKNYQNLFYFRAKTLKKLYKKLDRFQKKNKKRYLQLHIVKDKNIYENKCRYVCFALSNPTEVKIVDDYGNSAQISSMGSLNVCNVG